MPPSGRVSELIRLLYEAAADSRLWTPFLKAMLAKTNAAGGFVIALPDGKYPQFCHQAGFDASGLRTCDKDLILDRFREAGLKHGSWIGTWPNQYHQAVASIGPVANYSLAGMTLVRPASSGEFDARTASLLRLIAPHLKQGILLHHKLSQLRLGNSLLTQSLENTGMACLTIDAEGLLQGQTAAAGRLLAQGDGLTVSQGRLHALNPKEEKLLEAILLGALATGAGEVDATSKTNAGGEILISRTPPRKPLHLVVTPFHSDSAVLGTHPCALVFLVDPEARTHPRGTLLRRLFGLTPSEAKLGELLAEGLDVKCCAERMRITEASARFVLKRIFQKTGVNSQSGLMRLTLSLPCLPASP